LKNARIKNENEKKYETNNSALKIGERNLARQKHGDRICQKRRQNSGSPLKKQIIRFCKFEKKKYCSEIK
jgi:hypothetical protein